MKFIGTTDLSNQSKDIRKILSANLQNNIEELVDGYGYEEDFVDNLTYSFFVTHTDKSLFKAGKTKFTKAYERSVNTMIDESILDFDELGFLLYLSTKYTEYEDNYLRIDGELAGKNEIVEDMINNTKMGISDSSLRRKFKSIESKNILLVEDHPCIKKKKIYYLTPLLFYKGKYMDNKAKKALIDVFRGVHNELTTLVEEGKLDMKLNPKFDRMSDEEILIMCSAKLK